MDAIIRVRVILKRCILDFNDWCFTKVSRSLHVNPPVFWKSTISGHSNSKSTLHDWRYSDNIIVDCFTFVFFKLHMVWGMVSRKNYGFHKILIWSCNHVSCCITISGISVEVLHSFQSSQVLGNFLLVAKGIELE